MDDLTSPASESVATETPAPLRASCEFCAGPIDLAHRRRIRRRRFCSSLCRVRWHERHRKQLQDEAAALLQRTLQIVSELAGPKR